MTALQDTTALRYTLLRRDIELTQSDVNTLRKAQMTLHRWAEQECGEGNDYASWSIERDEETGVPYRAMCPHTGKAYRTAIADKERGALKRVEAICKATGLYYYHQTDPRGCSLYISKEQMSDNDYSNRGVACVV